MPQAVSVHNFTWSTVSKPPDITPDLVYLYELFIDGSSLPVSLQLALFLFIITNPP